MTDWNTNTKRAEKNPLSQKMKQLRIFQLCINFATVILINFLLLLRKGVYPYQDMDSWEKFDETLITPKGAFTLN